MLFGKRILVTQSADFMGPALCEVFTAQGAEVVASADDLVDSTVIRMPKAYPGYFGESYPMFNRIREYTDAVENLYLIGRNGMHRYNNQDHSMLTAMAAVDNIVKGVNTKENIWNVNTESEYHESR